jgi:hypothetical protein
MFNQNEAFEHIMTFGMVAGVLFFHQPVWMLLILIPYIYNIYSH